MTVIGEVLESELQPFLQSRRNFYQLLYLLFMEPKANLFFCDLGKDIPFHELEEIHEAGGGLLGQFFYCLSEDQIHQENEEYHRLFLGPGLMAAPPWESYYRNKDHLLFEECMYQIREFYHQYGLQNVSENREPDDSLLLELEFMIFLSEQCLQQTNLEALEPFVATQIDFLNDHLLIWIPLFCERIIKNTTSQLYLGAAMLLEDFCRFDLETLTETMEALRHV
ncbi:TorD/DmsD family molecular chaperone [Neobacillus sp. Marseille-QA0830]